MRWGSAISRQARTDLAVREAIAEARQAFGDLSADLVFGFLSPHHVAAARDVAAQLSSHLPGAVVLGCSAQSCIGGAVGGHLPAPSPAPMAPPIFRLPRGFAGEPSAD